MTGSDLSRRRLPFMSAWGAEPGPTVWLTACVHGDEVGGMVVIQEVFKLLRRRKLLRGRLCAFPLLNPIGFEAATRNVTFSKEDLNRSFPGNSKGSLAERIADIIFSNILKTEPDLVLDLHNDWMKSIPYPVLDSQPQQTSPETYAQVEAVSRLLGFPIVLDEEKMRHALSFSLLQRQIPALTIELGESYVVNERMVEFGVRAVLNVLTSLGMTALEGEPFRHSLTPIYGERILNYWDQPVGSSSGVVRFLVKPGDVVKAGRPVARIYNTFGKLLETLRAQRSGIVLGHADSSVAFPGAAVLAFGVI